MSIHLTRRREGNAPADRVVDVLRLLGRLELARARWVHHLIFADCSIRWCNQMLRQIHDQRLIWSAPVPAERVPGAIGARNRQAPPRAPLIWGLSEAGRAWLLAQGVETERDAELLRPRPWADPDLSLRTLRHDLLASDWCCSVLAGARSLPGLIGVRLAVEYVSARTPEGKERQRLDALLVLAFGRSLPMPTAQPLRYLEEFPPEVRLRYALALEIDTGSEQLSDLLGKAGMYRALTLSGHYTATVGMPVLPVVLVPTTRRGQQIAVEWRAGWPGGPGVIATFLGAQLQGNGLKGRYIAMTDPNTHPIALLDAAQALNDAYGEAADEPPEGGG